MYGYCTTEINFIWLLLEIRDFGNLNTNYLFYLK